MRSVRSSFLISFFVLSTFLLSGVVSQASAAFEYVDTFGLDGNGVGEMGIITDGVVDADGNVYVFDFTNVKILKFAADGTFLLEFGSNGSGDGQFGAEAKLGFDRTNNRVLVGDTTNDQVQVFTTGGVFVTRFGSSGSGDGQFGVIRGIAADSDGNIYVLDRGLSNIQKFNSGGTFITKWGSNGSGDSQLDAPIDMNITQDDKIFVVDGGNYKVKQFTTAGAFVSDWDIADVEEGTSYLDIQFDPDGLLYIVNAETEEVGIFQQDGTYVGSIAAQAAGARTTASALSDDWYLYYLDFQNRAIEIYFDEDNYEPEPTATPTPTPTSAPARSSSSNGSTPRPPGCSDTELHGTPDLYQIFARDTSVTLRFAPVLQSTGYYIRYGYTPDDERFGVFIPPQDPSGSHEFEIKQLGPNTTYYFTIRGQHGCMPGDWGNTLSATTGRGTFWQRIFYRYFGQ